MIKILISSVALSAVILAQDIYATFNVDAHKQSNLTLSSSGIVSKIYADVGEHVKKDQLILELDSDELKTSILLAKKQVELAQLNLKYAKKAYERFAKIQDVIDEEKFDNASATYERATLELEIAKASLANKEAQLANRELKAPYDGIISKKFVELGDGVSSAKMDPLFTLITPKKQILKIDIDEKYISQIKLAQTFSYSIDSSDKKMEAKISKIYPSIDPSKRSLTLEAEVEGLKVGMFGYGYLKVD
jgi:RND family efflux transporter MFP subunit